MAIEKVRHMGDLVACVAAVDEETALHALNLFEVEYEILDAEFDQEKESKMLTSRFTGEVNTMLETPTYKREFSKNSVTGHWLSHRLLAVLESGGLKEFIMDLQNRMQWLLNGMQPEDYNSTLRNKFHTTRIELYLLF